MPDNCIFCRIISGEFSAEKVYEDENIIVIKDIGPAAPVHVLVLPKKHCASIMEAGQETILNIFSKIPQIIKKLGLKKEEFRLVVNTGEEGGQTVDHFHVHLLAGRDMKWPPG
jgi:histidine triad (HIT) family protein